MTFPERLLARTEWRAAAALHRFLSTTISAAEARRLLADAEARRAIERFLHDVRGRESVDELVMFVVGEEGGVETFFAASVANDGTVRWRGPATRLRLVK